MTTAALRGMAAPDINEVVRLHMAGMTKLRELHSECKRLRDAGRLEEAWDTFRRAERVQKDLERLESGVRPKVANGKKK